MYKFQQDIYCIAFDHTCVFIYIMWLKERKDIIDKHIQPYVIMNTNCVQISL